jgi:hypothetical protein
VLASRSHHPRAASRVRAAILARMERREEAATRAMLASLVGVDGSSILVDGRRLPCGCARTFGQDADA